jgi:ABC-type transporter Mla subunit MlaD
MFTEEQIDKLTDMVSYLNSLRDEIDAQREDIRDKSMGINEIVGYLEDAAESIEKAIEADV